MASQRVEHANPLVIKNGKLDLAEIAAPGAAASGYGRLYFSSADSRLYYVTDGGTVVGPLIDAASVPSAAPTDATYITQTANGSLSNEQAMGALATGIVKNTTTTGVQSIAVEGTDYYAPGGTDVAVADGGTGASTLTGILKGNGTSAITAYNSGTDNHIVRFDGTGGVQNSSAWLIDDNNKMQSTTSLNSDAVLGVNNSSTTSAIAINASCSGASGANAAVIGTINSTTNNASAITGQAQGASGATFGVYGQNSSSDNQSYGLRGDRTLLGTWADLDEQSSAPADPASGYGRVYLSDEGELRFIDEDSNDRALSGVVYASIANSSAVTGTSLTAFDTNYTLPANTLAAARTLRLSASGTIAYGTGANKATSVSFFLRFGSTTICASGAFATTDSGSGVWSIDTEVTLRAAGAAAAIVGTGTFGVYDGTLNGLRTNQTGATTVDTTGTIVVAPAIQFAGLGHSSNTALCTQCIISLS